MQKIKVWDLPTRLFHWLLVASVIALVITGKLGGKAIPWHGGIGIFVLGLIVFRLVWGFVGSTYARFRQFFPTPSRIRLFLKGAWHGMGHNPLGALPIFALLVLTPTQAVLGLFTTDGASFFAPLHRLIDSELSIRLTELHRRLSGVLSALVLLHFASIVLYVRMTKNNLLIPMITGWKTAEQGESAQGGGVVALIAALMLAALSIGTAAGAWISGSPPPAIEEAQQNQGAGDGEGGRP
jgi:cytochrome b